MVVQFSLRSAVALWLTGCAINAASAGISFPLPVIIDTDIGTDADDAFALGLALLSPEGGNPFAQLDIVGITTCGSDAQARSLMVCRMLTATDREAILVAAGADPQPTRPIAG
jgi:purine nucleosidase